MSPNLSRNEKIIIGPGKTSRQTPSEFSRGNLYVTNRRIIFEDTERRGKDCIIPLHKTKYFEYKPAGWVVVAMLTIVKNNNFIETFTATWAKSDIVENLVEIRGVSILEKAEKHEKLLEFEEAAEMYKLCGFEEDVIRVREKARNKVEQTVVQGDQITKTEIKDSVLNRSNVGSGPSKMQELKDLTEMKEKGLIDDDEFKQMKKEILGK